MKHLNLQLERLEQRIAPGGCSCDCGGGSKSGGSHKSHKSGGSHKSDKSGGSHKSHGSKSHGSK
jgi:hypothetical protein